MELTYVCPQCKHTLLIESEAYRCRACGRHYPIVLGIPDFRLFPDPYISVEDDVHKAQALAQFYDQSNFAQLVTRYWEMTPGVPPDLVREFTRSALSKQEQSQETWKLIESNGRPEMRKMLLEIGCGTAGFLAAVGPMFGQAVGIDIAFRWLLVAKKRLEEQGLKNISLICGCAERLPFPNEVFDLIVAEDVLDHTRDPAAFLAESARVLKPRSAVFYLSAPNRYSLGPDPHVWVWGVGFLPPRLRDRYVRWRKGVPYGPIWPVSYLRLNRLLHSASFHECQLFLPELRALSGRKLSRWQRLLARAYEYVRRTPGLQYLLRWVSPFWQVLCRRP